MRHADIKLTMGVYTDPRLLDVRGALDALPLLPLEGGNAEGELARATGTDGAAARALAPTLAPTADNPGTTLAFPGNATGAGISDSSDVSGNPDKRKGRLSSADNRPSCRGDWIRTSDLLNTIQAR